MRLFFSDLKRGLSEPTFMASVVIGLLCIVGGWLYYAVGTDHYNSTQGFHVGQSLVLPFVAPLLACLPFSNLNMLEKDSGYYKLMLVKDRKKGYTLRRWLSVGLISGLAISVPLGLFALVGAVLQPYESIREIYELIALDFLFGFTYGVIGYALTFYNSKRYIPLVAPQVVYLLLIYAMPYLGLEAYYPPLTFAPGLLPQYAASETISGSLLGLMLLSLVFTLLSRGYKKLMAYYLGGETV